MAGIPYESAKYIIHQYQSKGLWTRKRTRTRRKQDETSQEFEMRRKMIDEEEEKDSFER